MPLQLPSSSALAPNAADPWIKDGILYRKPFPDGRDLQGMVAVEQAGWEDDLAFSPGLINQDLRLFPELQVLAIRRLTDQVVGRVSAVRFNSEGYDLAEMIKMAGDQFNWDDIYEHRRDPNGAMLEGSGLVVHPKFQNLGIARGLVVAGARAILDEIEKSRETKNPVQSVTFQSRNVGFAKWAIDQGLEPNAEAHRDYVWLVFNGDIYDPVLSVYAKVVSEANLNSEGGIKVINTDAKWHGDIPSAELGVRFDATNWFSSV